MVSGICQLTDPPNPIRLQEDLSHVPPQEAGACADALAAGFDGPSDAMVKAFESLPEATWARFGRAMREGIALEGPQPGQTAAARDTLVKNMREVDLGSNAMRARVALLHPHKAQAPANPQERFAQLQAVSKELGESRGSLQRVSTLGSGLPRVYESPNLTAVKAGQLLGGFDAKSSAYAKALELLRFSGQLVPVVTAAMGYQGQMQARLGGGAERQDWLQRALSWESSGPALAPPRLAGRYASPEQVVKLFSSAFSHRDKATRLHMADALERAQRDAWSAHQGMRPTGEHPRSGDAPDFAIPLMVELLRTMERPAAPELTYRQRDGIAGKAHAAEKRLAEAPDVMGRLLIYDLKRDPQQFDAWVESLAGHGKLAGVMGALPRERQIDLLKVTYEVGNGDSCRRMLEASKATSGSPAESGPAIAALRHALQSWALPEKY